MNKLMTAAVIAGSLMLLNSPEAAAHKEVRNVYAPSAYTRIDVRRSSHMPDWLHRHRDFRHWYQRTELRRDRRIAWHQLYEIFRWERRWGVTYYRSDNYWTDYYAFRYGKRQPQRDHRGKHRHRH